MVKIEKLVSNDLPLDINSYKQYSGLFNDFSDFQKRQKQIWKQMVKFHNLKPKTATNNAKLSNSLIGGIKHNNPYNSIKTPTFNTRLRIPRAYKGE